MFYTPVKYSIYNFCCSVAFFIHSQSNRNIATVSPQKQRSKVSVCSDCIISSWWHLWNIYSF